MERNAASLSADDRGLEDAYNRHLSMCILTHCLSVLKLGVPRSHQPWKTLDYCSITQSHQIVFAKTMHDASK